MLCTPLCIYYLTNFTILFTIKATSKTLLKVNDLKLLKLLKPSTKAEMWVFKVMDKFASMVMGKITSLNFVWCLVRKASLSFMIFKWSIVRLSVVQQHSLCLLHDGCTARPRLAQSKNILILIFTISFSTNLGHIFLYS